MWKEEGRENSIRQIAAVLSDCCRQDLLRETRFHGRYEEKRDLHNLKVSLLRCLLTRQGVWKVDITLQKKCPSEIT